MIWAGIDFDIIAPAFMVGALVLATHVPLGREVLVRGIIFIDLAIAQIAGLGIIVAYSLGAELQAWQVQAIALLSALSGALILVWMEKTWPRVQEAQIGVAFVLAASAGILLLSYHPHGAEQFKDLLAGQILWVDRRVLLPVAALSAALLFVWYRYRHQLGRLGFYLVFAVAITVSVQLVGIYLVFASLILPALAIRELAIRPALIFGYGLGLLAYALGLSVSALTDMPSGPVIVWFLALCAVVVWWLAPRLVRH